MATCARSGHECARTFPLTLAAWGYSKISHGTVTREPHIAQLMLSGVWAIKVIEVIRPGTQALTNQATKGTAS